MRIYCLGSFVAVDVETAPKTPVPPVEALNLTTVDYDQTGNIVFGGRGPAAAKICFMSTTTPMACLYQ